jgi:hypothetical protein
MLLVESSILTDNVVRANRNFASNGLCWSFPTARNYHSVFFYMLLVESSALRDKVVCTNRRFAINGLRRSLPIARDYHSIFVNMLLVASSILKDKVVRGGLSRSHNTVVGFNARIQQMVCHSTGYCQPGGKRSPDSVSVTSLLPCQERWDATNFLDLSTQCALCVIPTLT